MPSTKHSSNASSRSPSPADPINAAIAAEIGLSPRTVEANRLRLTRTLGLANSAELLAWFLNSEQ
ncbi:hypothetical protein [Martelella mediterranea]|uniref:hypothetical protein n=1 Tax=Martelella mediterranea TaxID=293089 RepID=UPI00037CA07F|nr:hypothetical protein [Martelella mediterranea]